MRNAIGNALLFNIVITMIILIIAFLSASLNYSKAFRIKNNILNSVEANKGYNKDEIEAMLKGIGYRINPTGVQNCPVKGKNGTVLNATSNYRYCVIEYKTTLGTYYGVTAYMYFDIPIISNILEIPVYGETKVIYNLN